MMNGEDGIEVVRWAEAVKLMAGLLPHVGDDEKQIYEDILLLISNELMETGERIVRGGKSR
jgi:hypothetical protein